MVGLPLFEDQMDNLDRLGDRGVALALDIAKLTPEILNKAIHKVITKPR